MLVTVAHRLTDNLRMGDLVARLGLSDSRVWWTGEELMLAADGAVQAAKRNGRGCVEAATAI